MTTSSPHYPRSHGFILGTKTPHHRGSQGVVKSKAETLKSYIVETPQGEYRRNKIHLKQAAVNTIVPANNTSVVPKVQVKSVYQHTHRMCKVSPIAPTQESPNNNKGNSNVSTQCVPNPQSAKVVDKAEIKEPR